MSRSRPPSPPVRRHGPARARPTLQPQPLVLALGASLLLGPLGCTGSAEPPARPPRPVAGANAAGANSAGDTVTQSPTSTDPAVSPAEQARRDGGVRPYTPADVAFLQGMIGHHAQAVQMARWAPTHGASRSLQILAERIAVSQQDEIVFMKSWLADRNETVPNDAHAMHGAGHDASAGDGMAMMPGMLTATELAQLDAARNVEFDRLFLTFMIKHHDGALRMVRTLLGSTGAAQDDDLYRFVADVNVDQETEIARMSEMLEALPPAAASPPPSF